MSDDMRDLFFIVKGQYKKCEPSFLNKVSNEKCYIGGYDPYSDHTTDWYMLLDNKTYHCVACGSDLNKVLHGVHTMVMTHRGVAKNYFKQVSKTTSDDYYEIHYLGHRPLTAEGRAKKAEGRCPRVSPIMAEVYREVFEEYGDFFRGEIEKVVEDAYKELAEVKTHKKSKKVVAKVRPSGVVMKQTPKEEETPKTPVKKVIPRVRIGMKRPQMS